MSKFKRALSTFLAAVVLISCFGITSFMTSAEGGTPATLPGDEQDETLKNGDGNGEGGAEEIFVVEFHSLTNKLFRYDNYTSSVEGIRNIDTTYATITPTVVKDDAGVVTSVTISAEQFAAIAPPAEVPMGFSAFLGWGATENANDDLVITDTSAGYTFDIATGTKVDTTTTFKLYAKFADIGAGSLSLKTGGNYYDALAYSADALSPLNMLPAAVLGNTNTEQNGNGTSTTETAGLNGSKTAQWEDYASRIGSIQFELSINDVQMSSDTDVIILLDKSTSMNNIYLGNNILAWPSAVLAVEDLAELLIGNGNTNNNRVALVQFAGNTINSFNFQNNYDEFISDFVTTSPSAAHLFRDDNGNIIYDHDNHIPDGITVENPSGDGTNFTVALEQAKIFAESRAESDREVVILMVSDGKPEAHTGFDLPYSGQMRHWTKTFNEITYHAVTQLASEDQTNPAVIANNGMSVINSGFAPVINTIGIYKDTEQLKALSTATGGSHSVMGWNNANDISSMSQMISDIFDGEQASHSEITDTVITDVITADFEILIDATHPITLTDNGTAIPLTENTDATLDLYEYQIETIDYNGETRQQIQVNIGTVDKNSSILKFFIVATDLGMPAAFYPTNEEHIVEYKEGEEEKSRNDLGDPELQVLGEIEQPPIQPVIEENDPPVDPPVVPVIPPVEPDDEEEEDPIVIPDPEPPLDDGPDEVVIDDPQAPLSSGAAWALLNLILTVLTALTSIYLLINYFKERKDENGEKDENYKRRGFFRGFSVVVALAAIIAFILTEDMTLPMIWTDKWTILMAAIAFVQAVVLAIVKKQSKDDEEVYAK